MEESREWNIQILDVSGNVKYQAVFFGTEKSAVSLAKNFERRWRDDNVKF